MGAVAVLGFRSTDWLMDGSAHQFSELTERIGGPGPMKQVLRYQVAEQNRNMFDIWEMSQIAFGVFLFGVLLFGTHEGKLALGVCLAMILLVTAMHLLITPDIIGLGRELDFEPSADNLIRTQLRSRHLIYSVAEFFKLGLGAVLGALLVWSPQRKRSTSTKRYDAMEGYPVR